MHFFYGRMIFSRAIVGAFVLCAPLYGMDMVRDGHDEARARRSFLQQRICNGDSIAIGELLQYVDLSTPLDALGHTPLHYAAEHGQTDIVCLLLHHGALPHSQSASGDTPLHAASRRGDAGIVEMLLARGAHAWLAGAWGRTPLHLAAESGTPFVVEQLLRNGADATARDAGGMRPLHLAMRREDGGVEVGEALVRFGDPQQLSLEDDDGDLPLDSALYGRRLDYINFLLWNGAPCSTDLRELTRELCEDSDIVRLLRAYGRVHGDLS